LKDGNEPISYCCFEIFEGTCSIIDYDSILDDEKVFSNMLNLINKEYSIRKFINFTAKNKTNFHKTLIKPGFYPTNIKWIRKLLHNEMMPLLIRTVDPDVTIANKIYNNTNICDINNWIITSLNLF